MTENTASVGRTLGEELLTPTRIYARDCLAVIAETDVRTFAHITGGGLARNLERVLPPGVEAVVERGTWTPAPVFGLIAATIALAVIGDDLREVITDEAGPAHVQPLDAGTTLAFEDGAQALRDIDERRATGKLVIRVSE